MRHAVEPKTAGSLLHKTELSPGREEFPPSRPGFTPPATEPTNGAVEPKTGAFRVSSVLSVGGDPPEPEWQSIDRDPDPCPACRGRGTIGERDAFGNWDVCLICEGTGIDPDDPESPL